MLDSHQYIWTILRPIIEHRIGGGIIKMTIRMWCKSHNKIAIIPILGKTLNHISMYEHVYEPVHEISNNVVCATSKASDQPAHTRSLIRAFARRLSISMIVQLPTEHHLECLSLKAGCRCSSESTLVKISNCWKAAQIYFIIIYSPPEPQFQWPCI